MATDPVRHFARHLDTSNPEAAGKLLAELAAEKHYFADLLALPAPAVHWIWRPPKGPRLVMVARAEGQMAWAHSHGTLVALAPIKGVETHEKWQIIRNDDHTSDRRLVQSVALHPGDVVTLTPPADVHTHGHALGSGPAPYTLILLGEDMYAKERTEVDMDAQGMPWRYLAPGNLGRGNR